MTKAVYPASFDPITCGHVDIAERAARMFDELIVGVYSKPMKDILFTAAERCQLAKIALAHLPNVRVEPYTTLTVDFAQTYGAAVIVRGLRAISDFEWELQLSMMNRSLMPNIDTICLMTNQEYSFLSSSLLKDIARNHGHFDHLAPTNVVAALKQKFGSGNGDHR